MLSACQLMIIIWGTDVMTSFRCLFIFYYSISIILLFHFIEPLYTHVFGAELIIYLFSVLGWSTELYPKDVAVCIFKYFYLE